MLKKVHYPNLNSLRFIAALVVIIHHTEQVKFIKGYNSLWSNPIISIMGKLGVDLFFVLSGFLITSLLLVEKQEYNKVSIKNFIVRRLLRIWPLYFLIMVLAFFVMPFFSIFQLPSPYVSVRDHFLANIILYVTFLPHVQSVFIGSILYASQCWSIGIEERFYLLWPFIAVRNNEKRILSIVIGYIILYFALIAVFKLAAHPLAGTISFEESTLNKIVVFLVHFLKFDCLLIGCFFSIINKSYTQKDSLLLNKFFQIGLYAAEFILLMKGYMFHGFFWEVHAVIYGLIILNLVRKDTNIVNLDYKLFDYLGKITYGMYMYHILIVNIVIVSLYKYHLQMFTYPVILILVFIVSSLSYKYFESYFLRKKRRFSSLVTG